MELPYNRTDEHSVLDFAKDLINKSLRQACGLDIGESVNHGKGGFGNALEKYYFLYEPNSSPEPDFPEIGLELKSSPLKRLVSFEFRAKERLVLNIINYEEIVKQSFETSDFWKKNRKLLLVFYLHDIDLHFLDYLVKLVDIWEFPLNDLEIIKQDWLIIQDKVANGKAHELSEGDTFYLGACTKGATASSVRSQPYSNILAKQRAFSFKQGYVNHIIASLSGEADGVYGKLISDTGIGKKQSIEEVVIERLTKYYGKSTSEIVELTGMTYRNAASKSFYASLTKAMLGIELDKRIEEFEKAEIVLRTVRLSVNELPKEDISFRKFDFLEIVNQDWEDSEFKDTLEKKFLFVFYQYTPEGLVFRKAKFWNMPYIDIMEAKKVWEQTKKIVAAGEIVKELRGKKRLTNFPNKAFNRVSHVRPHAQNASDTSPLPCADKITKAKEYTKHSFWLNASYVRDSIFRH